MKAVVTGAAGFIGAHVVEQFLDAGQPVVALDIANDVASTRLAHLVGRAGFKYIAGPLDVTVVEAIAADDEVWHLAANTDIPLSGRDRRLDLQMSPSLTQDVLEAMVAAGAERFVFASSGSVYGRNPHLPFREDIGPLLPCSMYGAGKAAAEAVVSVYTDMFDIRACIFRLGNVVGGRMQRGIVLDFVNSLRASPEHLRVKGNGRQRKSYVLVDDAVEGMYQLSRLTTESIELYNLAAGTSLTVTEVAGCVADGMGIQMPVIESESSSSKGWPGDQPIVDLDVSKAAADGFTAAHTASEAVVLAARRLSTERQR